VFPFGDCYHLAHSLYPMVRWNYLADLDRLLTRVDPAYDRYRSVGFLKPSGTRPSALSELRHRLCGGLGSAAAAEAIIRGAP
jgi:fatty acid desaturase